jgi:hypothetical protein
VTVAVPWVLWLTGAAVLGTVVAHLFNVGRPPSLVLPTARFVPVTRTQAMTRSPLPRDRRVLLLRVLALLAIGAACAGVQGALPNERVRTLLVADVHAADSAPLREALRTYAPVAAVVLRNGRVLTGDPLRVDTLTWPASADGSLAGALLAARRAAPAIAAGADSLQLVLLSGLEADATSLALPLVRQQWPGRVTVVAVPRAAPEADGGAAIVAERPVLGADVRSPRADDIVTAALAWHTFPVPVAVRVVRGDTLAPADLAHAEGGGVVVHWPLTPAATDSAAAVIARGVALVTPLQRDRSAVVSSSAIAWWPDGRAAVTERGVGAGCVREVGFAAPEGDALLLPSARGLVQALLGACGVRTPARLGTAPRASLTDSSRASRTDVSYTLLADSARTLATPRALSSAPAAPPRALTGWLLALGAALLVLEWLLRDRLRPAAREGSA